MSKKALNLYAGIGGNRKNWPEEWEVTAVEINQEVADVYKKNFPNDTVIVGDAHEYLLKHFNEFDFIWSSPPCYTHTRLNRTNIVKNGLIRYQDMKLYQEILLLQTHAKCKWVVENVIPFYEPLIKPTKELHRHLFWCNFTLADMKKAERRGLTSMTKEELEEHIGIKVENNIYLNGNHDPVQVLRNCVVPELGLHVLECAFKTKQRTLL